MSDIYALDLALNLPGTVDSQLLSDLRWHLDLPQDGALSIEPGEFPLFDARGPGSHVGGALVGELTRTGDGWSLTLRQEVHAEFLDDAWALIERLARQTTTTGTIGQLRFYEAELPEVLTVRNHHIERVPVQYPASGAL